jgi:hypothetical protein
VGIKLGVVVCDLSDLGKTGKANSFKLMWLRRVRSMADGIWKRSMWLRCPLRYNLDFLILKDSHLPDHVISHFSTSLKPFPCPHGCDEYFRNRQERKKHTDQFHESGAPRAQGHRIRKRPGQLPNPPKVEIYHPARVGASPVAYELYSSLIDNL